MTGMLIKKDTACSRIESRKGKEVALSAPRLHKLALKSRKRMELALLKIHRGGKRVPLSELIGVY